MKQKLKTAATVAALLVIAIWIIDRVPFNKDISQQITANVYENGVVIGQTTVVISGERSNYLFRKEDGFFGEFLISRAEKTDRDDLKAYIKWNGEYNTQRITYHYKGDIKLAQDMGVVATMLISDDMTKFAIMLTDHTIVATSDELCQLYDKHITWHSDTLSTSIARLNEIPKIT